MLFTYNNKHVIKYMTTKNKFENNLCSFLGYSKPDAMHTDKFMMNFGHRKILHL